MKKTIVVGDRVKVRGYCTLGKDIDGMKGALLDVRENGNVTVNLDEGKHNHCVKISQCIKLVKPPPKFYWIGKVRFDDQHHLWIPLVAHEIKPKSEKDADDKPWVRVRKA